MTHLVLQHMLERGAGCVVSISSDAAHVGSSGESIYSACKGGIISFTKTVAREMARTGMQALKLYYDTEESKEGVRAFREKRKPEFRKLKK